MDGLDLENVKTMVATQRRQSSAAGVLTIPGNAYREAILFSSPVGRTTLLQMGASDDTVNGVPIPPQAGIVYLLRRDLGSAIQEPITFIDSAAAQQTFTWIEISRAAWERDKPPAVAGTGAKQTRWTGAVDDPLTVKG